MLAITKNLCVLLSLFTAAISLPIATWVYNALISLTGDSQLNLGQRNKSNIKYSICHWNLKSAGARWGFLLNGYISIYKFNIVCTSQTYLDTSTASDDIIRSDHPFHCKDGGFCIYYKSVLPLRVLIHPVSAPQWGLLHLPGKM